MHLASTTSPTANEIEAIVRLVLQRLRALPGVPTGDSSAAQVHEQERRVVAAKHVAPGSDPLESSDPLGLTVRLDQRVVTLEDLRDRWGAMNSLHVQTRCIVTPSVQDELRYRGVTLQRFDPIQNSDGIAPIAANAMLVLIPTSRGKSDRAALQKVAACKLLEQLDDLSLNVREIERHLNQPQRLCLWSSPKPFAALLACVKLPSLVAVPLSRLEDLPAAMEQARPNVLILDDRRWTANGVASLARTWLNNARGGESAL